MYANSLRTRVVGIVAVAVVVCGASAGSALAASGPASDVTGKIGGVSASTLVTTMTQSGLQAAIDPTVKAQSVPITSVEEARLKWLAAGNLSAMSVGDATVAEELAGLPLTAVGTTTSTPTQQPASTGATTPATAGGAVTPAATGTCYTGLSNSVHYSDVVRFAVVVQAGVTGYCDGSGGQAIVSVGNYLSGVNNGIPDGCNAAAPGNFHHKGEVFVGPNSQWLSQLNTFTSGANTPFGCASSGSEAAAAARDTYTGYQDCYDDYSLGWGQPGCGTLSEIYGPY